MFFSALFTLVLAVLGLVVGAFVPRIDPAMLYVSGGLVVFYLPLMLLIRTHSSPLSRPWVWPIAAMVMFGFGLTYSNVQLFKALDHRLQKPIETKAVVWVKGLSQGHAGSTYQQLKVINAQHANLNGQVVSVHDAKKWKHHSVTLSPSQKNDRSNELTGLDDLVAGQIVVARLRLKPIHTYASLGAMDLEKWALSEGVSAQGTIFNIEPVTGYDLQPIARSSHEHLGDWKTQFGTISYVDQITAKIDRLRLSVRKHFAQRVLLKQQQATCHSADELRLQCVDQLNGLILALITGDRYLLPDTVSDSYRSLGISHLLAISGPHVVLAALMLTALLMWLINRRPKVYLSRPRQLLMIVPMLSVLGLYTLFAGMQLPALRTFLMVSIVLILRVFYFKTKPLFLLLISAFIILLFNPLAALSVSFYLSFGAVALLMIFSDVLYQGKIDQRRDVSGSNRRDQVGDWQHYVKSHILRIWHLAQQLFLLHIKISVVLIPITLFFFGQVSWLAPLSNAIAVPWMSSIVLPINMLGVFLLPLSPTLADHVWNIAEALLGLLHNVLLMVNVASIEPIRMSMSLLDLLGWMLAMSVIVLPIKLGHRIVNVGLASILALLLINIRPLPPKLRVSVLDVGQGLSVVIQTAHHTMVYDTGAKLPNAPVGMGEKVVVPYLVANRVRQLDLLMLSHLDIDHSGGTDAVVNAVKVKQLAASQPWPSAPTALCDAGQQWQWDGMMFEVLSPNRQAVMESDNENSCVLKVSEVLNGGQKKGLMLFTGDAGLASEEVMVSNHNHGLVDLSSQILVVGHHGSKNSSGEAFLNAVHPQRAVVSAGYLNHYGHPHNKIIKRLRRDVIKVDSTVSQGTLIYTWSPQGLTVESSRVSWPWLYRMELE